MKTMTARIVLALVFLSAIGLPLPSHCLAAAKESALLELIQPTSSPLAKLQLIGSAGGTNVFLQPQVSGFLMPGGFFVTVAHPYDSAVVDKLQAGTLTGYAKFPLFAPCFFDVRTNEFPKDLYYVDESKSLFKNHTYFVRLTFQTIDYENDFSIWTFNPKLAAQLPSLKFSKQKNFPFSDDYYLLQSADPQNSTGYMINPVKLDGLMFQHAINVLPGAYIPRAAATANRPLQFLLLGDRLIFNGFFKFGTSGSPFLNSKLEVIGMQSSALYTQYKYAEYLNTTQGIQQVQYEGNIFNRCVAIKTDVIRAAIAKIAEQAKSQP